MFTGIVTDVGSVRSINGDGDIRADIETSYDTSTIEIGASIACSGVCLTVVDKGDGWFSADISRETSNVTNLSQWKIGQLVNLERSLKLGDELGGHIVTGHVDCVGELVKYSPIDDSIEMMIRIDSNLGGYVAKKGSVTINGVSLTVNAVDDTEDNTCFSINIIPHTQEVTSFRNASAGDLVNVEFDVLARYVARLQEKG
tara:strand:- start:1041 stop:1640 length:600 start_codon:yes stop_codon:yes gene_type:complete